MDFEAPETIYKLDFSDTQYTGLEIAVRGTTIDELLQLETLMEDPEKVRHLFEAFAGLIVSWNVTRKGEPVPMTAQGLRSLEDSFVMAVISAWYRSVVQAPPPLPGTSGSGGTSPEAALDLASQSASLPS